MDYLRDNNPYITFGEDIDDATIIYFDTDSLYNCLTNGSVLYLNISNGYPSNRINITNYICDKLQEVNNNIKINRNAQSTGSVERIGIYNFKWKFRYPSNFFDPDLYEDRKLICNITELFNQLTSDEQQIIWVNLINNNTKNCAQTNDNVKMIYQLFDNIISHHAQRFVADEMFDIMNNDNK